MSKTPRTKPVRLSVTFEHVAECPEEWDENTILFYFEENNCIGNYIIKEYRLIEDHPGACDICSRANVKVIANSSNKHVNT